MKGNDKKRNFEVVEKKRQSRSEDRELKRKYQVKEDFKKNWRAKQRMKYGNEENKGKEMKRKAKEIKERK